MSNQDQLHSNKFRNWVKGGLSFYCLKEGIKPYVETVVQLEHNRIMSQIGSTPGKICHSCTLNSLKPSHSSTNDNNRGKICPYGQNHCNCLRPRNKIPCQNNVCHVIYEEIIRLHASTPPSPQWKNTDIAKWTTHPWEIAKCFINAKGYADKHSPEEIDCSGLIHVFINNKNYQRKLSQQTVGLLDEMRTRRNILFHSPSLELEDQDLTTWIRDIIKLLEDPELKIGAASAIQKLNELQKEDFIITCQSELEMCNDAIVALNIKLQEANENIKKCQLSVDLIDSQQKLEHQKVIGDIKTRKAEIQSIQSDVRTCTGEIQSIQSDVRTCTGEIQSIQSDVRTCRGEIQSLEADWRTSREDIQSIKADVRRSIEENEITRDMMRELSERQSNLERAFALRTEIEERINMVETQQNLINKTAKRLDARRNLATFYREHLLRTSTCPLKAGENKIDISDVYVPPVMTKEIKEEHNVQRSYVTNYTEIFEINGARCKRIYVLGNVGSGKSAFCKMVVSYWCQSVSEPTLGVTKQRTHECDYINTKQMKDFDFMFYIPLRRTHGISNIRKMVHQLYCKVIQEDVLSDILDHFSERCIILADGLDEWSPGESGSLHVHLTYGIPDASGIIGATILTTSRPSAPGILNMKYSEFDQTLMLHGIAHASIDLMVSNYCSKISYVKPNLMEGILSKIEHMKIADLENSPLLLQQIVWLLCNGKETGHSVGEVITSVVNIAFTWMEVKFKEARDYFASAEIGIIVKDFKLPCFEKYPRCKTYGRLMFVLGKIAFELLIQYRGSQVAFGRHVSRGHAIDDKIVSALLNTGLLLEENCFDPTSEKTQFSFVHTCYLEYFAALYIMSSSDEYVQVSTCNTGVLAKLFEVYDTVEDVLQLENVVNIICGLGSVMTLDVCQNIYRTAFHDGKSENYRKQYLQDRNEYFEFRKKLPDLFVKLQNLYVHCLSNYQLMNPSSELKIPILDLVITRGFKKPILEKYIDPLKVLHVYISASADFLDSTFKFANLQTLVIDFNSKLSHNNISGLAAFVSKTQSLQNVSIRQVCCTNCQTTCKQVINLSGHCQLETLHDIPCSKSPSLQMFDFKCINTSNLEYYETFRPEKLASIRKSPKLKILKLNNLSYKWFVHENITTLLQLEELVLVNVQIEDGVLEMDPTMVCLRYMKLCDVKISISSWHRFIDSLLRLPQPVTIERTIAKHSCFSEKAFEYVSRQMFEILEKSFCHIKFVKR